MHKTDINRDTQESLNYALYPSAHNDSVSEILGFIRSIDEEEVEEHIRKDNAVEDEDEEEYILSDLEDFETQQEYIEANPSTSCSYNYSKKRKFSDKEDIIREEIQDNDEDSNEGNNKDHIVFDQEIEHENNSKILSKKERRRANRRTRYQ